MDKYPTIEIDGEIYRKINGRWVDPMFLVPPRDILKQIIRKLYNFDSLANYSTEELREQLLYCKNEGILAEAIAFADELQSRYEAGTYGKADVSGLRWILPVRTSLYRMMRNSEGAIKIYNDAQVRFGDDVLSGAVYTSVAAAYCDVGDYDTALKVCKKAWALGEKSLELNAVYERIKKQLYQ